MYLSFTCIFHPPLQTLQMHALLVMCD